MPSLHGLEEIAARMKAVRKTFGEQKAFAARLGIPLRTWQEYEKGKTAPGARVFAALSNYGVSVDWLLTGEGSMFRADQAPAGYSWPASVNEAQPEPLDEQLLASVIELVDRHLAELEKQGRLDPKRLPAAKRAKIVALVYADAIERHAKSPRKALVERIIALLA